MKRIWHPYWNWEDWKSGMWRKVSANEERKLLPVAVTFTGNAELYGSYMMRVINEWPISCEHNLTDQSLNKLAWIGHGACCIAHGLPEYIVRKAWGMLSENQRECANKKAVFALEKWRKMWRNKRNGWQLSFEF